nr:rod shape-determining protein [Streptomyces sp. SID5468]
MRRCTVAVDLGASRTRVYLKGTGIVVDEPSVVAVDCRTGSLVAVGTVADLMTGRTPEHIRVLRPISNGTVVDIGLAQRMLRNLMDDRLRKTLRRKPVLRAAACVPYGSEPVSRRAAVETLTGFGARRVELVDSLVAAAIGCGLPVEHPEATCVVLCGASTTQVAVLSLGSIVTAETIPVGGEVIDRAIVLHLRHQHALMLPSQGVRPLHAIFGTADAGPASTQVYGTDAASGMARSVEVDAEAVRLAIRSPLYAVLDAVRAVLRRCPPDLVADLVERGITLAGGGAALPGLRSMLHETTHMPVHVADHPGGCVVRGLGAMIEGQVRPMAMETVR